MLPQQSKDFKPDEVRTGDHVRRLIGGTIPMQLVVEDIDSELIYCFGGWTFCRKTGVEVDEVLRWGPQYGITGSYLTNIVHHEGATNAPKC